MAGKYPSPVEARSRYIEGVEAAKDLWVSRCRSGAPTYELWYTGFANTIYPLIKTLPAKTGNVDTDIDNRVKPVARAIKELSSAYRATKIDMKLKAIATLVTR